MPTTIESLELEILSSSTSAESGLDKLSKSLEKLKQATSGGIGLTAVAKQIKALDNAAKSIDQGSVDNLNGIARAINTLSNLGGIKLSSTIATQITAIGNAARTLDGVNFSPLSSLASSLGQFGTIGNINLNPTINQLSRIPELTNKLSTVDTSGFSEKIREITEALRPLSEMPKQNISSTLTHLKKLPDIANSLNGIDMSAFKAKIQEVADALRPLADEMANVAAGFSAFPARIQRLISTTNSLSQSNGRAATSYINLYAKLKMAYVATKRVATAIANAISESSEWDGIVYRFGRTFGDSAQENYEWIQRLNKELNINTQLFMQYSSVYGTMLTGYGVAQKDAATMAMGYAELTYDIWAGFNDIYKSYEDAAVAVRSAIAGEVEPIRKAGFTIVDSQLKATAAMYGIEYSSQGATEELKSYLRYLTLVNQAYDQKLVGTYAREMSTAEGLLRTIRQQLHSLAQTLGSVFLPIITKVLPYVQALFSLLNDLIITIAKLFNIEIQPVDFSKTFDSADNSTGGIVDNLNEAATSAKKLKSYMLGIDELNVISTTDNSGTGGIGGDYSGLLDVEKLWDESIFKEVSQQVNDIVTKVKEWLGLTEDIDSWSKLLKTRFGKILISATAIGTAIAGWKIAKTTIDTIKTLKELMAKPSYAITISAILTITGFAIEFSGLDDAVKEGLNGFNFAEIVGGGLLGTGGAALLGQKIAVWISTAFSGSAVSTALTGAASNLGLASAGAAGAALSAGIAGIVAGIPMFIVGLFDAINEGIDWMSGALIGIGATAAGAGIGTIIGACGGPLTAGIGALIGLAVGLITDFTTWFWQKFDEIEKWFKGLPDWLQNIMPALGLVLGGVFSAIGAVITLIKKWDELWAVYGAVWNKFADTWVSGFDVIKTEFEKFFTKTIPEFFTKTIPDSLNTFWATWDSGFKEIQTFFEGIGTAMIDGIVEGWQTIWTAITEFVDGFVQGFKDALGIHSPSKVFEEIGNFLIYGLFNGMLELLRRIGEWCETNIIEPFKKAMDGALQFGVEVINNAAEWWGNVKTWWNGVVGNVKEFTTNVKNNASTWWNNVNTWWNKSVGTLSASVSLSKGWSSLPSWLTNLSTSLKIKLPHIGVNWIDTGFMDVKYPKFSVSYYAKGGFPDMGQMFIAREAGPELVGSIGNKNAVVNNDQIVESVSAGVYQAVIAALGSNGDEGGDTQIVINLDGEKIYENQQKIARGRGYNLGMGVFSFG